MNVLRRISHLAALCLAVGFLVYGTGAPQLVASLRGAVFLIVVPFLFLLVGHGPKEIGRALADGLAADLSGADPERLHLGSLVFRGLGRFSLALGVLGCFWACAGGLEALAGSVGAPRTGQIAPWLAQGFLLPALGALLRWFVWGPLAERMEEAMEAIEGA